MFCAAVGDEAAEVNLRVRADVHGAGPDGRIKLLRAGMCPWHLGSR